MKIIKSIKEKFNKNETVIPLSYKPGDAIPGYPKPSYGWFRHAEPELSHLTDDEIEKLLKENSDSIQEDYIKAEAWDKLVEKLNQNIVNAEAEHMLMEMQRVYVEVEKDYK
ncbi:hypothetical protein [Jeotgalicoccus sp. WY2]|uniref:hypothetical protein n=1 Tax=Jeotgalicoccus sp. WY2 TaxID=2708346 RepID=UPI001BD696DE|nr:hypothetical protein [Jeotgalicoccus sp. WY2]